MTKQKRPAHAGGTATIARTPTVPDKITAPLNEPQEALQNAARAQAEAERQAHVVELFRTMHALYVVVQGIRNSGGTPSADLLARHREAQEAFQAAGGHEAMGITS
jgi:hypothetical protein